MQLALSAKELSMLSLLSAIFIFPVSSHETAPTAPELAKAIRLQGAAKRQLVGLIQSMRQASIDLEKSDPDNAKVLAAAAEKAQIAFVTEDMEKVIELIQAGLMLPAEARQTRIVKGLQDVLDTLRRGSVNDVNAELLLTEKIQLLIARLEELLLKQQELERHSYMLLHGEEHKNRLSELQNQITALADRKHVQLKAIEKLSRDPIHEKLLALKSHLEAESKRATGGTKLLEFDYPTPDKMLDSILYYKDTLQQARSNNTRIKALLNDQQLATHSELLKVIFTQQSKATDELQAVVLGLEKDDLGESRLGGAQAVAIYRELLSLLVSSIDSKLAQTATGSVLIEQANIRQVLETLLPQIEYYVPNYPIVRAGISPEHSMIDNDKSSALNESSSKEDLELYVGIAERLRSGELEEAQLLSSQAFAALNDMQKRMRERVTTIDVILRAPEYERQSSEQNTIAVQLMEIATKTQYSDNEKTSDNGLLQESNLILLALSKKGTAASAALEQRQITDAHNLQFEIATSLRELLNKLKSSVFSMVPELVEELKEQWLAGLERAIMLQKICLNETQNLFKRKKDGEYSRADLLAMNSLEKRQRSLLVALDEMEHLMSQAISAHVKVTWPPIVPVLLLTIRGDVAQASDLLLKKDASEFTQQIQKNILDSLEGMLSAMKRSGENMTPPPAWADNGFGSPDVSSTDLRTEILILISLQTQLLKRTQALNELVGRTADRTKLSTEIRLLSRLQNEIRRSIENMLVGGIRRWKPENTAINTLSK